VIERGTGRRIRSLGKPLAGKTGTTNQNKDAWFIGFSPDLVAGVFIGFDRPTPLGYKETGSRVAVPAFKRFMAAALADKPATPFRIPRGVRLVRIDGDTGLLPRATSERVILEAFKPGTEPGLQATRYFGPEAGTTASGAHAMIVEVDRETMMVKILKYVVVHDCGTPINPMVVEGQIHGGVAQGIGNAFYEKVMYDDAGQIMNATLADYLIPTSMDVPVIELDHIETPSTMNPLGIKGVGEAGAIPVAPAFAQAVEDALGIAEGGSEILEIPLSPNRLWELAEGGTQ